MARLSFRCDEELVARVDKARGMIPREPWLRRAVERVAPVADADLERELANDEARIADEMEAAELRGISAPDY